MIDEQLETETKNVVEEECFDIVSFVEKTIDDVLHVFAAKDNDEDFTMRQMQETVMVAVDQILATAGHRLSPLDYVDMLIEQVAQMYVLIKSPITSQSAYIN